MLSGADGERFVHDLCDASFFADYVFPNPTYFRNSKPKELCDALVLFDDVAVLFEVKTATHLRETNPSVDKVARWVTKKRAKAAAQLAGAIGCMRSGRLTELHNARRGKIGLVPKSIKEYYGIIILDHPFRGSIGPDLAATGAADEIVVSCNFDEFHHLCDDLSTLADFLRYLRFRKTVSGRVEFDRSNELDLLSAYQTRMDLCDRASESDVPVTVLPHQWEQYRSSRWRKARKKAERKSFIVDKIVDNLHESFVILPGQSTEQAQMENVRVDYLRFLDVIARISRCERIEIGERLFEKSDLYIATGRPRFYSYWRQPLPPIVFVVSDDRDERRAFLANVVTAAQLKLESDTAMGVAISSANAEFSSTDWVYSDTPCTELSALDDGMWKSFAEHYFAAPEYKREDQWDVVPSVQRARTKQRGLVEPKLPTHRSRFKRRSRKSR